MALHDMIQHLRVARGMTQDELAAAVGITAQTISLWENGKRNPSRTSLSKLAEALNVQLGELMSYAVSKSALSMPVLDISPSGEYSGISHRFEAPIETGASAAMRYTGPDFPGADIKSGDLVLVSDDKILEDGAVYIVEIGDMMYLAQIFFIENNQIVIKAPGGFSWVGENRSDYFHAPPPGDMESPYIIGKATHVLRRIAHVNKQ